MSEQEQIQLGATKKTRGKRQGTSDTVNIPMSVLSDYLKGNVTIPVRRKWAEAFQQLYGIHLVEKPKADIVVEESLDTDLVQVEAPLSSESVMREGVELHEEEL